MSCWKSVQLKILHRYRCIYLRQIDNRAEIWNLKIEDFQILQWVGSKLSAFTCPNFWEFTAEREMTQRFQPEEYLDSFVVVNLHIIEPCLRGGFLTCATDRWIFDYPVTSRWVSCWKLRWVDGRQSQPLITFNSNMNCPPMMMKEIHALYS